MNINFKKIKEVGIIIIVISLFIIPFSIKHELKGTSIEFHEQRGRWMAILSDERKEERPLYLAEDCKPDMFKPKDWKDFFVLSSLPEGYILHNVDLAGNFGEENIALSYIFYKLKDVSDPSSDLLQESKITFTQSKYEVHYIPIIHPNDKEEINENEYYYREWKDENLIYWRIDDLILCMQGNYDFDFLEEMANNVKQYNAIN